MEQIAINILPKGAKPVCHSSQYDEGRQIMFNLFNDATPYTLSGTETISVLVRKPDGAEVVDSVTNTSDSYIIWDVSADACELSGVCECELSIVENGIVLGSKNFTMKVEEDAYGGRNIEVRTASGRIATFNTNMVEAFKSLKSDINPVQSGTATPSPQNVRPISGFSALNVTRTGKNLLNGDKFADNFAGVSGYSKDTVNKTVSFANSTPATNYHQTIYSGIFKPNTRYTFIFNYTAVSANRSLRIGYTDGTNGEFYFETNGTKTSLVVTSASGKTISEIYLSFFANGSTTIYYDEIGIFEGVVTLADFEPYNEQTATVNFGQTVYGGVADVTNGKVTITHGYIEFDGTENWTNVGGNYPFAFQLDTGISNKIDNPLLEQGIITNLFPMATVEVPSTNAIRWQINGTTGRLFVYDYAHSGDIAGFKQMLSDNKLQMIYNLATPIEITTTPENLTAIVGQNNVYSDTNGDTEVKYYIEV